VTVTARNVIGKLPKQAHAAEVFIIMFSGTI